MVLECIKLLLHFFGCLRLVRMVYDITAAEALLYLDKSQLESWTKLMQSDGDLRVLLFVLVVFRQRDFAPRQIVDLALRAIGAHAISCG